MNGYSKELQSACPDSPEAFPWHGSMLVGMQYFKILTYWCASSWLVFFLCLVSVSLNKVHGEGYFYSFLNLKRHFVSVSVALISAVFVYSKLLQVLFTIFYSLSPQAITPKRFLAISVSSLFTLTSTRATCQKGSIFFLIDLFSKYTLNW